MDIYHTGDPMSEFVPENDVDATKEEEIMDDDGAEAVPPPPPPPPLNFDKKKKKSGAFGFFRAALQILRKKGDENEDSDSGSNWKKIVGSMRPLHLQEMSQSPYGDEFMVSASPAASTSSFGSMSQYASAVNLRDLDNSDEEAGDPDEVFDAATGDEMIDAKADEFIAQFYRQVHLQNSPRYGNEDGKI